MAEVAPACTAVEDTTGLDHSGTGAEAFWDSIFEQGHIRMSQARVNFRSFVNSMWFPVILSYPVVTKKIPWDETAQKWHFFVKTALGIL